MGKCNGTIWLKSKMLKFTLVFYHFEGMKYLTGKRIYLNLWRASKLGTRKKVKLLYGTYIREIELIRRYLTRTYNVTFEHMITDIKSFSGKKLFLEAFL